MKMSRLGLSVLLALSLGAPLSACGGEEEGISEESAAESSESNEGAGNTEDEAPEEPAEETAAVDEDAPARAESESYVVEVRPADTYHTGELGQFEVVVRGNGGWHLNQDFPFSVRVAHADTLSLPKERLGKDDAAEFGDDAAQLDVPFTPSAAGEHAVSANVDFAVCDPQSCVPHTVVVGARLAVADVAAAE